MTTANVRSHHPASAESALTYLRPCEYSDCPCEYSEYPCEYSEYPAPAESTWMHLRASSSAAQHL